jgi:hypothetical protein
MGARSGSVTTSGSSEHAVSELTSSKAASRLKSVKKKIMVT